MSLPAEDRILYTSVQAPTPTRSRRGLLLALVAFVAVVGGFAGTWAWFSQTSDTAASSIPADMDFYFGIDAIQLISGGADQLTETVAESFRMLSDEAPSEDGGLFDELRAEIIDELGLSPDADPFAWVGRTAALAFDAEPIVADMTTFDPYGPTPDGLLVVESRDKTAAVDFVRAVIADLAEDGNEFVEGTLEGDPMWTYTDQTLMVDYSVAVTDETVVAGTADVVRRAISLDPSESLAQSADYVDMTSRLSPGRLLTGFFRVDPEMFAELAELDGVDTAVLDLAGYTTSAFSVSVTSEGVEFESVVATPDDPAVAELYAHDGAFAEQLGSDTLAFIQLPPVTSLFEWAESFLSAMGDDGESLEAARAESIAALGFDVIDDFLLLLDGTGGLALTAAEQGSIDPSIPLSGLVAFSTSDPATVSGRLEQISAALEREGLPVDRRDGAYISPDADVTFGMREAWLTLALTEDDFRTFAAPGTRLADDATYAAAIGALGPVDAVHAYVDIAALVDLFADDPTMREALSPYRSLVSGSSWEDGYIKTAAVFTVDTTLLGD